MSKTNERWRWTSDYPKGIRWLDSSGPGYPGPQSVSTAKLLPEWIQRHKINPSGNGGPGWFYQKPDELLRFLGLPCDYIGGKYPKPKKIARAWEAALAESLGVTTLDLMTDLKGRVVSCRAPSIDGVVRKVFRNRSRKVYAVTVQGSNGWGEGKGRRKKVPIESILRIVPKGCKKSRLFPEWLQAEVKA